MDNDISWTLFFKIGDFSWTLLSTKSPLFGRPAFWVNSSGHFLMVIINSANRRGCESEASARLSEHCSVPG